MGSSSLAKGPPPVGGGQWCGSGGVQLVGERPPTVGVRGGVLDGGPVSTQGRGPLLEPASLVATFEAHEDGYRAVAVRVSGPRYGSLGAGVFHMYDYEATSVDGFDVSRDAKMPLHLREVLDELRPGR
jgi:hypothetical protein